MTYTAQRLLNFLPRLNELFEELYVERMVELDRVAYAPTTWRSKHGAVHDMFRPQPAKSRARQAYDIGFVGLLASLPP